MTTLRVVDSGYGFNEHDVGKYVEVIQMLYHDDDYFDCVVKVDNLFTRKVSAKSFGLSYNELKLMVN